MDRKERRNNFLMNQLKKKKPYEFEKKYFVYMAGFFF